MRNSILRVRPKIACHAPPDIASVSCSNIASGGLDGGLMGLDGLGCLGLPACLPVFLPTCLPPRVARQATGGARARSSCLAPSGEERSPPGTKLGAKQTDARLHLRVNLDPRSVPPAQSSRSSLQSAVHQYLIRALASDPTSARHE